MFSVKYQEYYDSDHRVLWSSFKYLYSMCNVLTGRLPQACCLIQSFHNIKQNKGAQGYGIQLLLKSQP